MLYSLQTLFVLLLFIAIGTGLIATNQFYASGGISFYCFCTVILILVIFSSLIYFDSDKDIFIKMPIIFFCLLTLYVVVKCFNNSATLLYTFYIITLCFLLIMLTSLQDRKRLEIKVLFCAVMIISFLESVYCIFQYLEVFISHSPFFKVTGSHNNPNVTAIFLALSSPIFLFFFDSKIKRFAQFGFFLMLIVLFLLKCRSAYLGVAFSAAIFYALQYDFILWIKSKKNKTALIGLISSLGLVIIIPACMYLYDVKKESSEGRKFIWKISAYMAAEKPISGYGYGYFERDYNLYQSHYIKSGKATMKELQNAGPVIMPHNELLLNAVQGGVIGLGLMVLFFIALLFTCKEKRKIYVNPKEAGAVEGEKSNIFNVAYAGTIGFIIMSMVNSTLQVIPTMCLMIVYGSVLCSVIKPVCSFRNRLQVLKTAKASIVSMSLYLIFCLIGTAVSERQNKKAMLAKEAGNYQKALKIMSGLESSLKENGEYWQNYGQLHFKMNHFKEAAVCYEKAKMFTSLPSVYLGAGKIQEKMKHYPNAVREYQTLIVLYPAKFSYKFLLLDAYLKNRDRTHAMALANEIIALEPKTPSAKVDLYKNRCRLLLRKLDMQKANKAKFQI